MAHHVVERANSKHGVPRVSRGGVEPAARAKRATEAYPGYRVDSAVAGQHVIHGDSAHHPRLPALHRRVYGRTATTSTGKRNASTRYSTQTRPPWPRLGYRHPLRFESHRPTDGEPVQWGPDRPHWLRFTDDDRAGDNVPVDSGVRMWPQLRPPVLRAQSAGRRLGVRRHGRTRHDRRPIHGGERTVQGPGHSAGLHKLRLPRGPAVRWRPLPVRRKGDALPHPGLRFPNGRLHAIAGDETAQATNIRLEATQAAYSAYLAPIHGPVHRSLQRSPHDVQRSASLPGAHNIAVDGRQPYHRQLEDRDDLAASVLPTRLWRHSHRQNGPQISAAPVANGSWRPGTRRLLLLPNPILQFIQGADDSHLRHLLRHSAHRHRPTAYPRLPGGRAVRFRLRKHLRHRRHIVFSGVRSRPNYRWRRRRGHRIHRAQFRYRVFESTLRTSTDLS